MKWTAAAFLLLGPQDPSAQELFDALQRKAKEARTIRSEIEYKHTSAEAVLGDRIASYVSSFRVEGPKRWAVETRCTFGSAEAQSAGFSAACDGRVVRGSSTYPLPARALKPEEVVDQIRRYLLPAVMIPAFVVAPEDSAKLQGPPEVSAVRDGGRERIGSREARVLEYSATYQWGKEFTQVESIRLVVDAARLAPLSAEGSSRFGSWSLTFTACAFDEDLPDSDFAFHTRRRLATAQASQLARSVELFGRFTGRLPARADDLLRRPEGLDRDVFFPAVGFVLGAWPRDPWGRPFELRLKDRRASIVSPGADGKAGGAGEDEDIVAEAPPAPAEAVGAPSERLSTYYEARVRLHLLASAVRAYRDAYGELPRKAAALWQRPDGIDVWPDGGWVPEGRWREDPWGQPLRIVTDKSFVRIQVADPKTRHLAAKNLTGEEKASLEKTARPRLAEADRKAIEMLLDAACDDDLDTREEAFRGVQDWGAVAVPLLNDRLKRAKDSDHRRWLGDLRQKFSDRPAAWTAELAPLAVTVGSVSGSPEGTAGAERNAAATLRTFAAAQADFRSNDRDGNKVNDFWTGDVAGLYSVKGLDGNPIKLIELSAAAADAAPLEDGAAGGGVMGIEKITVRAQKAGYHFQAMTLDRSATPPEAYRQDSQGDGKWGKVHNPARFGVCAFPAEYPLSGARTFIINEGNTIFCKDTGGEPVVEWPSDEELMREWKKLD